MTESIVGKGLPFGRPVRVLVLGSVDPDSPMVNALAECFHNPANVTGILGKAGMIPVRRTNGEGKKVIE